MADTVTIATTENKVTVQTVGQDLVTLTSPAADQVTVALGVGPVSLAGQTTDSLGEGSTNLYFSNARASAAAPVQSVTGSTGMNIATTAAGAVSVVNTKLGTVTGVTMPSGYAVADVSGALTVSYNNLAAVRTGLGLVPGTSANQIVQLDGSAKLPAVDGSALTNLPSAPTFGIANTNAVKVDSTSVADDEYARFTANGLESRATSEVLGDIGAAAASHNHAAGDITSGTLAVARIPDISTDKLTSGTLAVARGGTGLTSLSTLLNSNQAYSDISGTPTLGTAAPLAVGISNNNVLQADANVADDDFLRVAGTQIEGRTAAQTLGDIGAQAALTFGKSSGNSIKSEAALDTNDFLRVGTTHVVGRTNAEVLSDIGAAAAAHTHEDSYAMFITAPADKASPGYVVDARVASARTITNFYAKTESGSCVATLRNITDNVEIASVTANSTGASDASLLNTAVAENERIGVVISSNSSGVDLQIVVEYTA